MNTQEKLQALRYLVPGCQYATKGDVIEWLDERPMPNEQEMQDALPLAQNKELKAQAKASRQQAYRDRSDPIFMQWQRGEATEQEWLDEVAAIRLEFPYPEEL